MLSQRKSLKEFPMYKILIPINMIIRLDKNFLIKCINAGSLRKAIKHCSIVLLISYSVRNGRQRAIGGKQACDSDDTILTEEESKLK